MWLVCADYLISQIIILVVRKEKRSAQVPHVCKLPSLFSSSLSVQAVGLVIVPNKVTSACMLQSETLRTTEKFVFRNRRILLAGLGSNMAYSK